MSHINSLPLSVLAQILRKAALPLAGSLHVWKEKLPLLAVCRAWAKLAEPFVFSQAFVEILEACDYKYGLYEELKPDTHSTLVAWTSNAELVISRNCMLMTKRLEIWMPSDITCDNLQHLVLGTLKLDHVDWTHVNTLSIGCQYWLCEHSIEPIVIDEQVVVEVKRTIQYFGQNMRGIVELNLNCLNNKDIVDLAYTNLATIYGRQLQVLRTAVPVALGFSYLWNIAVLELSLDVTVAPVIPSVCGETLKVLKLDNVPHNFAWHHYRYDIYTRPIVFCRLTILHLSYKRNPATMDEIQSKVASGALNCDQLVFPVLKRLFIRNCTPDCDLLYAEAPFPELRSVHLSGLLHEISHCSRLKLVWVRDLHIKLDLTGKEEAVQICNVTNHFFSSICIGQTAILDIAIGRFTLDPELIRWINLTSLELDLICYKVLCRVIARCPNIAHVWTYSLDFGVTTLESLAMDKSLFSSADALIPWGAKLASFTIVTFGKDSSFESRLRAFINALKNSYPHLAKISFGSSIT
ncbi:hypothetical protein GGI06_000256 [Coemansia sp. S85]|nr:hypothetical protein GGI06_000256 [Coemansia sp. S85]